MSRGRDLTFLAMFSGSPLRSVRAPVARPVRGRPVVYDLLSTNLLRVQSPAECIITDIVQRQSFDADYVRRLEHFDPETERDFVAYFGELLSLKLRSRLRSPELIQDVTQETFLRVLKTLRQSGVQNAEALGGFVNSVCNNILFEAYRAESRVAGPAEDRDSGAVPADDALCDEEERTQVRSVLSELPEKDRTILRWLFFEERDKGEVCRVLHVDREYLRVLVHRAKQRFRNEYLRRVATKANRATPMS
jgi:RNA polymerase sigma-70 factor (ECF subfamily)